MLAVTALVPAVWLVTLISTVPSGSVVTVEATVAPLSANTLTVTTSRQVSLPTHRYRPCPHQRVRPSNRPPPQAIALMTTRSAIFAVLTSAINVTF
ncbi:putative protein [Escherichia coli]|nr:putative protein [Escherichia coli]